MNFRRQTAAPQGLTGLWWYQGESDNSNPNFIADHTALVTEMREEMGANLPIIYVQLGARNGTVLQFGSEAQRRLETGSGDVNAIPNHHMAGTYDLPLYDSIHINGEAQRELGRRVALATRQHILGEDVDGTGPRLQMPHAIFHPGDDLSLIRVKTTQSLNDAIDDYDDQFRVFDDGDEVEVLSTVRDPSDPSAILITLLDSPSGPVTVSLGDVSYTGGALANVPRGPSDLPLPRFGPLEVELESSLPSPLSGLQIR
jgi:hypothetical protein